MNTYKFVSSFDEPLDEGTTKSYYQVAQFADRSTHLHHIRKYIVNGQNEFESVKEYNISKSKYKKLLQIKQKHEYKLYAVYDLNIVGHPTVTDILLLKSNILSTKYDYTGYSPF